MSEQTERNELVEHLVKDLWEWLLSFADAYADGDDVPELLEEMGKILRKFPVDVEVPETIWRY